MEVLAHHGVRVLELRLEPRRGVREAPLRRGEAVVGGDEGVGEALGDPPVGFPRLAPEHDQVLGRKGAGLAEVLLLDGAEVREEAGDGARAGVVGLRARRAVDRLQLAGDQQVGQRAPGGGVFTPGGQPAASIGSADHGVSMSPIHHSIAAGSSPTKRRKWRYQIEPLAV